MLQTVLTILASFALGFYACMRYVRRLFVKLG